MATNPSDPVARMYAVALYETAHEKQQVGKAVEGLELINEAWQDKTFRDFFTSPRIPRETKISGMDEALRGKVSDEVLNFVKVLIIKGREPLFDNIVEMFHVYRDQAENRVHAWVESGSAFNEQELEQVKQQLSQASGGKEIVLHYDHKPELLGGARVRLGDKLIDNTLRTRLKHLAMALSK
jgi:F-type H+-transporting ATPase subunit delta